MFQPLVPCLSSLVGSAYPNSVCLDPYGSAVWRARTPLSRKEEDRGGNHITTKNTSSISEENQRITACFLPDTLWWHSFKHAQSLPSRVTQEVCAEMLFFNERPFNKAGRRRKTLWIDPQFWKRDCLLSCWASDEWADVSWCNSEDGVTKVSPLATISLELKEKNLLLGD